MSKEVEKLREYIVKEACKNDPDFSAIRREIEEYEKKFLDLNELATAACLSTGAAITDLFDGSNKDNVVMARDLIVRYLFYQRKLKKAWIGEKLNRDHTSILYSLNKTDQWDEDKEKVWIHFKKIFIKNLVAMKHTGLKNAKVLKF